MFSDIKQIHILAAFISVAMYIVRFVWAQLKPQILQTMLMKTVPHLVDTILLVSAIYLCVSSSQYPFLTTWLSLKVLAVIFYIVLGYIALRKARLPRVRWGCFALSLLSISSIFVIASTK